MKFPFQYVTSYAAGVVIGGWYAEGMTGLYEPYSRHRLCSENVPHFNSVTTCKTSILHDSKHNLHYRVFKTKRVLPWKNVLHVRDDEIVWNGLNTIWINEKGELIKMKKCVKRYPEPFEFFNRICLILGM